MQRIITGDFEWRYPTALFLFIKCITVLGVYLWTVWIPADFEINRPFWLNVWFRWDSGWIMSIVEGGYSFVRGQQNNTVFFPLLPLLTRWLGGAMGNYKVAGLMIVNFSYLLALMFLFNLVRDDFNIDIAKRTVLYLAVFPVSFIFSMFYTESLFLLFAVGAFYFVARKRWLFACCLGMLASMTRLIGIALMPALLIRYLEHIRKDNTIRKIRAIDLLYFMIIPAGLIITMAIFYKTTGDGWVFLRSEQYWDRHLALPWVSIVRGIRDVRLFMASGFKGSFGYPAKIIELSFAFIFIMLIPLLLKHIRLSYAVFALIGLLIPLCSANILAFPRYTLPLFPFFILFGILGNRHTYFTRVYLLLAVPLFSIFLGLFISQRLCF